MTESLIKNLLSLGEEYVTSLSNRLFSNPTFLELLKKGVAVKEAVDEQVAQALKKTNLATKKDLSKLERRLAQLESEVAELKYKAQAPRKRTRAADDSQETE